ncbi:MAG: cation:proton antiporter, partial [Candidatus Dojkabacteria bacterium]
MELTAFTELGIILGLAALLGIVFTRLKQPAILGYILCGLIIGPLTTQYHPQEEQIELFKDVGITLLLFVLGLELNIKELKNLGSVAFATGIGQIIFTSGVGYFLSLVLGFGFIDSMYIAIALTFSSTIIIVKLLSTKGQIDSLYGRISVGFLLVQDFVAILLIIGLTAMNGVDGASGSGIVLNLGLTALKGVLVGAIVFVFARFVLNPLLNVIRRDKEILFITVIAWAVLLAGFMHLPVIGFSIEIGGLLAGITLSGRFEHLQIESWTRPLRDFFLILFFVVLGLQISVDSISSSLLPAVLFSLFVLIGNPLIVMIIMGALGYSSKIGFLTSLAVAQISEFSLILINFAMDLGHVDATVLTTVTLVGGITMTVSTYLIYYNEEIYERFSRYLKVFEFSKKKANETMPVEDTIEAVLFGCHRMGRKLLKSVPGAKKHWLVVDIDPQIVAQLQKEGYKACYGDIGDSELYEAFKISGA